MSDDGRNVAFLGGNTWNKDYTMWPTITRDELETQMIRFGHTGDDDKYYNAPDSGLTVDQIEAIMWRVRRWELTEGVISARVDNINVPSGPGPMTQSATFEVHSLEAPLASVTPKSWVNPYDHSMGTGAVATERENNLISLAGTANPLCNLRNLGIELNSGVHVDEEGHFPGALDVFSYHLHYNALDFIIKIGRNDKPYGVIVYDDGLLTPYIQFQRGFLGPGNFNVFISTYQDTRPGFVSTQTGTLTIDPIIEPAFDVPLWVSGYYGGGSGTDPSYDFTGSCNFKLEATKFFTYQNSLGQDVYDEISGDEIAEPLA